MSYVAQEESVESGQPIELFLFQNILGTFTYTSGQANVVFDSRTYIPRPISRSDIQLETGISDKNISLTLPADDPFALRYVVSLPVQRDEVTIYRFHSTDGGTPEVITFFKGVVTSVDFRGDRAEVNVLPLTSQFEQILPKQTYRNACNHILYDNRCKIVKDQFKLLTTVSSISADGQTITLDGDTNTVPNTGLQLTAQLTATADFFDAGFITIKDFDHRMVLSTSSGGGNLATFTILLPFQDIEVGETAELFAGCSHSFTVCGSKFANKVNYGGFPFVPTKNPFATGIIS